MREACCYQACCAGSYNKQALLPAMCLTMLPRATREDVSYPLSYR